MSLTADLSFRAFINGQYVAQGPSNIGNDFFDVPLRRIGFQYTSCKKYLGLARTSLLSKCIVTLEKFQKRPVDRGR